MDVLLMLSSGQFLQIPYCTSAGSRGVMGMRGPDGGADLPALQTVSVVLGLCNTSLGNSACNAAHASASKSSLVGIGSPHRR